MIGFQTGNGFGRVVIPADIKTLVKLTKHNSQIKAVGGLHYLDHALEIIHAGATHIGTSNGPELMKLFRDKQS